MGDFDKIDQILYGQSKQDNNNDNDFSKIDSIINGKPLAGMGDFKSKGSEDIVSAIKGQESGGDYTVVNPDSGASGAFQIMPENWDDWAEETGLGRGAERSQENQNLVAHFKLGQYIKQFGDPKLAAAAWYAGPAYAQSLKDGNPLYDPDTRFDEAGKLDPNGKYPSVNEYANDVLRRMGMADSTGGDSSVSNYSAGQSSKTGVIDSAGRAIKAGFSGVIGGMADLADVNLGVGKDTADYFNQVSKDNQRRKRYNLGDMVPFASDYWTNPEGAAYDIGQTVGSSAALLPVTAAIGAAMPASAPVTGAVGLSLAARSAAGMLGKAGMQRLGVVADKVAEKLLTESGQGFVKWATAGAIGKIPEAASEGGNIVSDLREAGYSDSEIRNVANKLAVENVPWLMLEGAVEMTGLTGKLGKVIGVGNPQDNLIKSLAKNAILNVPIQSIMEGGTELKQTMLSEAATGKPTGSFFSPSTWTPEEQESFGAGLVGGGFFGGIGSLSGAANRNTANQDPSQTETGKAEQTSVPTPSLSEEQRSQIITMAMAAAQQADPQTRIAIMQKMQSDDGLQELGAQFGITQGSDLEKISQIIGDKDSAAHGTMTQEAFSNPLPQWGSTPRPGESMQERQAGNQSLLNAINAIAAKRFDQAGEQGQQRLSEQKLKALESLSASVNGMSEQGLLNVLEKNINRQGLPEFAIVAGELVKRNILPPAVLQSPIFDQEMLAVARERAHALRQQSGQQLANLANALAVNRFDQAQEQTNAKTAANQSLVNVLNAINAQKFDEAEKRVSLESPTSTVNNFPNTNTHGVSITPPIFGAQEATTENTPPLNNEIQNVFQEKQEIATQAIGKTDTVRTDDGTEFMIRYKVVPAESLVTSHDNNFTVNPDYPTELQPRNRDRAAMQQQVIVMANHIRPADLADSRAINLGAPIVNAQNVVENGNGRAMGLRIAYSRQMADQYKQYLIDHAAKFGLDPKLIALMNTPVLVRERISTVPIEKIITSTEGGSSLGASEQAAVDASLLTYTTLKLFAVNESGDITTAENREFIKRAISDIATSQEMNAMLDVDGKPSKQAYQRIRNAVFAKAYNDKFVLARMAESEDNNIKNIVSALLNAAPTVAGLKAKIADGTAFDINLGDDAVAAAKKLMDLRDEGKPVNVYLQETTLFAEDISDEAKELLAIYDRNKMRPKRIADIIRRCAITVEQLGHPNQITFWSTNQPTKSEILASAKGAVEVEDQNLFGIEQNRETGILDSAAADNEGTGAGTDQSVEPVENSGNERVNRLEHPYPDGLSVKSMSDGNYIVTLDGYAGHNVRIEPVGVNNFQAILRNKDGLPLNITSAIVSKDGAFAWAKKQLTERSESKAESEPALPEPSHIAKAFERLPAYEIVKTKHTRTGQDLWVVKLKERIDKARFNAIRNDLKRVGGAWSSFTNGFNFTSDPRLQMGEQIEDDKQSEKPQGPNQQTLAENTLGKKYPVGTVIEVYTTTGSNLIRGKVIGYENKKAVTESDKLKVKIVEVIKPDKRFPSQVGDIMTTTTTYSGFKVIPETMEFEKDIPLDREQNIDQSNRKNNSEDAAGNISDWVKAKLLEGNAFTSQDLFNQADKEYGGSQGQGTYTPKDAYDALELGVNKFILDRDYSDSSKAKTIDDARDTINKIREEILAVVPTQTKRTAEQEEFQQFSTPPHIAYVAAWVSGVSKGDSILEPSAGVGGIATFAKATGAKVYVNELSERRAKLLQQLPFEQVFTENAEQINNILPDNVKPTVILMNPPFSSTAGRMQGKRSTINATLHIEQALKRLEPNGRLVAIVGRGMADNAASFQDWWKKIKSEYNVRANIGIDGSDYTKYGTTFDIQLLVIDKTGKTEQQPITGSVSHAEDVLPILEAIRNDRQAGTNRFDQQTSPQLGSEGVSEGSGRDSGPDRGTIRVSANRVGNSERGSIDKKSDRNEQIVSDGAKIGGNESTNGNAISNQDGSGVPSANASQQSESTKNAGGSSSISSGSTNDGSESVRIEVQQTDVDSDTTEMSESTFDAYKPQRLSIPGAKQHPTPLVQSAAMAAVEPPAPAYSPKLPPTIIKSGKLSIAQIEPIVYAGQSFEQTLPNNMRKGFFIGDGTGVGKGREIAGIILDSLNSGKKKAVWVSKNDPLFDDAVRDLTDIGGKAESLFPLSKIKLGGEMPKRDGVLFVTYPTLAYNLEVTGNGEVQTKAAKKSRMDQLIEWLGKDYDGVIAFDEAHMMANSVATKGSRGIKKASARGLAGVELQNRLPKARIVYVSATGATEVENLAYASRLGLWGEGTPFADVQDFISEIKSSGLAAMELVARDMKALGVYLARNLSYDGVTYGTLEHQLTPEQREIYDTMAEGWQIVLKNIHAALQAIGAVDGKGKTLNSNAKKNAMSAFWGSQQRFFNQILTSMQMPSVIEDVKAQIKAGNAVVMQLVNTNEATQNRAIAAMDEDQTLEDLDLTPRDILMQFLDKSFPIEQYEEYIDDEGNKRSRLVVDSKGNPVINREAAHIKDELMRKLGAMKVPDGPLEMVINTFGTKAVAEVTGRQRRVVREKDSSGHITAKIEPRSKAHNKSDVKAFLDDKKSILIFSDAGGTGQSFHAGANMKNQRRRIHYLIQPGWRADGAVQGFGRTHRSGEVSQPHYMLVTTNLKGQKRFISTIARRLDQLGALTKGQRDAANQGLFSAKDNLESEYARDSLQKFYENVLHNVYPEVQAKDLFIKMGLESLIENESADAKSRSRGLGAEILRDVPRFLNRLLTLQSQEQNAVFDRFMEILEQTIDAHIANGTLDVGMETYRADGVTVKDERTVYSEPKSGAETKYIELEAKHRNVTLSYDQVKRANGFTGIYRNNKSGKVWAVRRGVSRTNEQGRVEDTYVLQSPSKDRYRIVSEYEFSPSNWTQIKDDPAATWDSAVNEEPKTRTETLHMISGAILPIWDRLPQGHARVLRVQTDEGKRFLGRLINERDISATLKKLGASREQKITAADAKAKVLNNNYEVHLANGWKLVRRRVSGENRIEIIGDDLWKYDEQLKRNDVFTERIQWNTRYFLPTGETFEKAYSWITKDRPVTDILPPAANTSYSLDDKVDNSVRSEVTESEDDVLSVADALGVKVILFNHNNSALRGFYKGGTLYLNRNGNLTLEWTLGHEFTHFLSENKKGLYSALRHALGGVSDEQINKYRKRLGERGNEMSNDDVIEEIIGDEVGNGFGSTKLWENLQKKTQTLFSRVIQALKEWLLKVSGRASKDGQKMSQESSDNNTGKRAYRKGVLSSEQVARIEAVLPDVVWKALQDAQYEFHTDKVAASRDGVQGGKSFAQQLNDWAAGIKKDTPLVVGSTPDVLLQLGVKQLPIEISRKVVAKIVNPEGVDGGKHGLSIETLKQLPEQLANPIMVFKSATVDKGIVVLTELVDSQGRSVIAAIHLEVQHGSHMVNALASVYGRNNVNNFVEDQIDKGRLLYADKEKSRDWLRSRGLQLPKEVAQRHDSINSIVQQSEKDVNVDQNNGSNKPESRFSVDNEEPAGYTVREELQRNFPDYRTDKEALALAEQGIRLTRIAEDNSKRTQTATEGAPVLSPVVAEKGREKRGKTVGLNVTKTMIQKGAVSLVGHNIKNPKDLAVLAQVLRHPGYEVVSFIFMKGNKVVHHEALTSYLPSMANYTLENETFSDFTRRISDTMQRVSADGYYVVHNHPSGDPIPSSADRSFTKNIAADVPGLKAHVIINSKKYSLISPTGKLNINLPLKLEKDSLLSPEIKHPALGVRIDSIEDIPSIAKHVQQSNSVSTIFYLTNKNEVRGVQEVSNELFDKPSDITTRYIRWGARAHYAESAIVVTDNPMVYNKVEQLVKDGVLDNAVDMSAIRIANRYDGQVVADEKKWIGQQIKESANRLLEERTKRDSHITRQELKKRIETAFEVPLRWGRINDSDVSSTYKKIQQVLRSKSAFDWPAIFNALGQLVNDKLQITGESAEDVAKTVELWLQDDGLAQRTNPALFEKFVKALDGNTEVSTALMDLKELFAQWEALPAVEKYIGSMSFNDEKHLDLTWGGLKGMVKKAYDQIYIKMVEPYEPIKQLVRKAEKAAGMEIPIDFNPYVAARLNRGWKGKAITMIEGGNGAKEALQKAFPLVDFSNFKSLRQILNEAGATNEEKMQRFAVYANAVHTVDMMADQLEKHLASLPQEDLSSLIAAYKEENNIVDEDAANEAGRKRKKKDYTDEAIVWGIDAFKHGEWNDSWGALPKFKAHVSYDVAIETISDLYDEQTESSRQDLVRFSNTLIDIMAEAGLISDESRWRIRKKWDNYVPMHRVFEDAVVDHMGDSMQVLVGSTRDVINPLESIISNTYSFIARAEKNKVRQKVALLAGLPGIGSLIEGPLGTTEPESLQAFMQRVFPDADTTNLTADHLTAYSEYLQALEKQLDKLGSKDESSFAVRINGQYKVFQTTPEVYQALYMSEEINGSLWRIFGFPARMVRITNTVLSPVFFARNMIRDAASTLVFSDNGILPWNYVRGISAALKRDDLYWEYLSSGAAMADMVSIDRNYMQRDLKTLMASTPIQKLVGEKNLLKIPFALLRHFTQASELAPRIADYAKGRQNGETITEAAFTSRDLMDFARGGAWAKHFNQIAAFFNANIQGWDKFMRTFNYFDPNNTKKALNATARAMLWVTFPSLLLWFMNKDDDRYKNLPQWQKDLFWIIPTDDMLIRIPKPFELGVVFGSIPERFLTWAYDKSRGKDSEAWKDFGETVKAIRPEFMPSFAAWYVEWITGKSLFTGQDIVPGYQKKWPERLQYGPNTSMLARWIGEATDMSPRKIDAAFQNVTGGAGKMGTDVIDYASGAKTIASTRIEDAPFVTGFTAKAYQNAPIVNDLYEELERQETLRNELKMTRVRPKEFNPGKLARLQDATKRMSKIAERERFIMTNTKISGDEKKMKLESLAKERVKIAQRALGKKD